jgi:hypothetical protein
MSNTEYLRNKRKRELPKEETLDFYLKKDKGGK